MPLYFFTTQDGGVISDEEGTEVASLAMARVEAVRLVGEMLQEDADHFWTTGALTLTVSDEAGAKLFTITVRGDDGEAQETYQKPLG